MLATLIQIDAWDPAEEAAVTLRACSHDDPAVCHLAGEVWWPAISQLPKLRYDFFSGSFDGQIDTPSSNLSLITEPFPTLPRLALADARLRLWTGELGGSFESYVLRFDGIVTGQPRIEEMTASLDFAVDDRWLDTPLLALYAGTTGIEGEAGQKGTPKPLSLGQPRYVPGVLIDSVDTILQLSAYGAVEGIDVAMERLNRFGAAAADYASLAGLKGAAIPRGGWATCEALGLVRHGAPIEGLPSYLLRGDAAGPDGWARKPGQIIRRIADLIGKADRVSDSSLDALDVARPWNLSLYLADQVTARDVIQRIAASVNAVAGVSWLGELFVAPISIGEPDLALRSDGTALPVLGDVKQIAVGQPYWRIALQAQRTWQVHALSEIAFSAVLLDRGRYDPAESYREGDIVDMPDASRWLHIGTAPTTGIAPGSDPAVWFNLSAALSTEDILYPDGTPVADLQPAEAGADVTGNHTANNTLHVADMLAEEIVATALDTLQKTNEAREQLATLLTSYLQAMKLAETREARAQGVAWLDGDHIHTVQRRETTERIEGDAAIVQVIDLIGAANGGLTAFVLNVDTVKVSPTETVAERLNEIDATFASQAGTISANYTSLDTAISTEESARVTAIDTLTATVDTLAGDTDAAIVEVQEAIADETSARTSAITALTSTVTTLSGTVSSNYSTLNTAISNESTARASALISVYAAIGTNTSSITSLGSALTTESSTRAAADTALTASIGSVSSTVTTHSAAITDLTGRTGAYWSITTNASSGATAFIAAQAETSPGTVTSNVAFGAKEVHISNPGVGSGWIKVLSVTGGNVDIYGHLRVAGSVTTPNLVSNSVTKTVTGLNASDTTGTGDFVRMGLATLVLDYDADVVVIAAGFQNYTSGVPQFDSRVLLYNASFTYLEGHAGPSGGAGDYQAAFCFFHKFTLTAGTYYVEGQWLGGTSGIYLRLGSGVVCMIMKR